MTIDPSDVLTPEELAKRLKVPVTNEVDAETFAWSVTGRHLHDE